MESLKVYITALTLNDIDLDTDEEMVATNDEPMAADNTNQLQIVLCDQGG